MSADSRPIHHMSLASYKVDTRRTRQIGELTRGATWSHTAGEGYDYLQHFGTPSPEELGNLVEETHRAGLDGISVSGALGPAHLAALGRAPLRYLGLSDVDLRDEDHALLGQLGSLEVLSLTGCWTGDAALPLLAPLTRLKWLDLRNTNVTGEGLRHLAALADLEGLELGAGSARPGQSGPHINDDGVPGLLALRRLRVLNLYGAALSSPGLIELLAGSPSLESLDLSRMRLTPRILDALVAMPALRFLELGLSRQADDGMLVSLARSQSLEGLALLGCKKVTDRGVAALAARPNLRFLQLYETGVSSWVLDSLAHTGLRFLGLAWIAITDADIPKLAAMASLEWVDLRRTQVGPEGHRRLAALRPDLRQV